MTAPTAEHVWCICGHVIIQHDPSGRCHFAEYPTMIQCGCWAFRKVGEPYSVVVEPLEVVALDRIADALGRIEALLRSRS